MTSPEYNSEARKDNSSENVENLREVERIIASAIIISSDGYILMGQKDASKGGVYSEYWHIPGGGVDKGESLEDAVIREVREEVGMNVTSEQLRPIPIVGEGETTKVIDGEKVWCKMKFNRFEIRLDQPAAVLSDSVQPSDDLVKLAWFNSDELGDVKQIPGGKEFFIEAGYIQS